MIAVCAIAPQPAAGFLGLQAADTARTLAGPFRTFMNKSDASSATQALTKELVVQNKMGIHARPAAMIVRITNKFKSEVLVEKDDEQVNGKSIMGLMMLAAGKGSKVKFIATGEDAAAMLTEIEALFSRRFDEA
jgi:phosphocarrier protein HPr